MSSDQLLSLLPSLASGSLFVVSSASCSSDLVSTGGVVDASKPDADFDCHQPPAGAAAGTAGSGDEHPPRHKHMAKTNKALVSFDIFSSQNLLVL